MSVKNSFLFKLVQDTSLDFDKTDNFWANEGLFAKICFVFPYKFLQILYDSFYYYFAPTSVIFISFVRLFN